MAQRIVIVGSGFAGMWAALSAARARAMAGRDGGSVEIVVVSPDAAIVIRPRLYETAFEQMAPRLEPVFEVAGVRHVAGHVQRIDTAARAVEIEDAVCRRTTLVYDRLVLASGSSMFLPEVQGLIEHSFNVDQLDGAIALDRHLRALAQRPESLARNTVVVAGGGFTGIETAAEMPERLRAILGTAADTRVIVLEQADAIGPDLGPGPRPVIDQALRELGVEVRTGATVTAVDEGGATINGSERIASNTVIWTAGLRASGLAGQVPGKHDRYGRLHVSRNLQVQGVNDVFATGDVAFAATDDAGNHAMMSCQHAMGLGRSAGHNAAADLLGLPPAPYSQPKYVTCLDLGPWGAVYTEGWEREVKMVGAAAKALKRDINTLWIYPPEGDREAIFAAADPARVVVA